MWQHDFVTPSLTLVLKIEDTEENQKENENRKEKENKLSLLLSSLTDDIKKHVNSMSTSWCIYGALIDNTWSLE